MWREDEHAASHPSRKNNCTAKVGTPHGKTLYPHRQRRGGVRSGSLLGSLSTPGSP